MVFCRFFLMMVFSMILTVSINVDAKVKVTSYDMTSAIKVSSKTSGVNGSSVIASSENNTLDVLGFWFVNSGLTYSEDVVVMRVAFNNFLFDSSDGTITVDDINLIGDITAEIQGDPLFYPNPMRFSDGGELHYRLTTGMDLEIHMYDIFGRRIYKKECPAYSSCGKPDANVITFDKAELGGFEMSSGVYFYIFIYEGEVIGRGKVAVVP